MQLTSNLFLCVFLPAILLLYSVLPNKMKDVTLLLGSLVFLAWGTPYYLLLMLFLLAWNYGGGLWMERCKHAREAKVRYLWLVAVNVLILFVFAYGSFLLDSFGKLLGSAISYRKCPVPIGISVYTLHAISYVTDVCRREVKAEKNPLSLGIYLTFFPQLLAGPVSQYKEWIFLADKRGQSFQRFGSGAGLFLKGLAKKVLLADTAHGIFLSIMSLHAERISVLTAWLGCFAFAFWMYYAFSGYSDMAVGLGKLFGYELPKNFDRPYLAGNLTEFWRRWNISLGKWLKEYVPLPVFFLALLAGLWYGGSANFLVWGIYMGILLFVEQLGLSGVLQKLPKGIGRLYTVFFVLIGWGIFSQDSLGAAFLYIGRMFGVHAAGAADGQALYLILSNGIYWISYFLFLFPIMGKMGKRIWKNRGTRQKASLCMAGVFLLMLLVFAGGNLLYKGGKSEGFFCGKQLFSMRENAELLLGNRESAGVWKGKDHYLFEKNEVEEPEVTKANVDAMKSFQNAYPDLDMSVILVPSAANVLEEKLPAFAVTENQSARLLSHRKALEDTFRWIDAERVLKKYKEEAVYYRTDSRWTSLGAYYVYQEWMTALGKKEEMVNFRSYPVSTTYQGPLARKSGFEEEHPEEISVYIPKEVSKDVVVAYGKEKTTSMYQSAKLKGQEQYEVFLNGNHGLVDIRTKSESEERLLVVKDSFGNCFVPLLAPYYREIVVVDPEYYEGNISEIMAEKEFSGVLFLYSENAFVTNEKLSGVLSGE